MRSPVGLRPARNGTGRGCAARDAAPRRELQRGQVERPAARLGQGRASGTAWVVRPGGSRAGQRLQVWAGRLAGAGWRAGAGKARPLRLASLLGPTAATANKLGHSRRQREIARGGLPALQQQLLLLLLLRWLRGERRRRRGGPRAGTARGRHNVSRLLLVLLRGRRLPHVLNNVGGWRVAAGVLLRIRAAEGIDMNHVRVHLLLRLLLHEVACCCVRLLLVQVARRGVRLLLLLLLQLCLLVGGVCCAARCRLRLVVPRYLRGSEQTGAGERASRWVLGCTGQLLLRRLWVLQNPRLPPHLGQVELRRHGRVLRGGWRLAGCPRVCAAAGRRPHHVVRHVLVGGCPPLLHVWLPAIVHAAGGVCPPPLPGARQRQLSQSAGSSCVGERHGWEGW